jgi:two-component system, OmpR family, aerobic respiration control sensor histidine kinase ArcB
MRIILDKDNLDKIGFLEKIISKLPGLVYCKSTDGVYLSCNEAQAKIIGFSSPMSIIGKTDFDFLNAEEATRLTNRDKLVMSYCQFGSVNNFV